MLTNVVNSQWFDTQRRQRDCLVDFQDAEHRNREQGSRPQQDPSGRQGQIARMAPLIVRGHVKQRGRGPQRAEKREGGRREPRSGIQRR